MRPIPLNKTLIRIGISIFASAAIHAPATTIYVDSNCTNSIVPFASWATAATNLQDAVDTSANGDLILVTNGVYRARPDVIDTILIVTNQLKIRSANGPAVTFIDGEGRFRCSEINSNTQISGFTFENGNATGNGGAAACDGSVVFSNCVFIGNSSSGFGGATSFATLNNCTLISNTAPNVFYGGGGARGCVLNNCILQHNSAENDGGGMNSCTATGCLIEGNSATFGGGAWQSTLYFCTIVSNTASDEGGGAYTGTLGDSILLWNNAPNGSNYYGAVMNYCCTAPVPSGVGNFMANPLFLDPVAGNFHVQPNSPCINSGNNFYGSITTDLDGNPRIMGGTADLGAYEFQAQVAGTFLGWLQKYALPTNGSVDFADSDADGLNNSQEWIAGTDPTNTESVLKMLAPVLSANSSNVTLSWQSVNTRTYYLQRAADLTPQSAFESFRSNIAGQAGTTTSFTNSTATNANSYFYRVGVQ